MLNPSFTHWLTHRPVWHNQGVPVTNTSRHKQIRERPPLDAERLERLALHYVGRFATSRGKLATYLNRKVRERGWDGEPPDLSAMVERFADLGYVDDKAFAEGRARSLGGRGFGKGRVRQALYAAGIGEEDAASAHDIADESRWSAALRFAQKRRIGPWAAELADRPGREKAMAAMIRAGHDFAAARIIASAPPGEVPHEVS